MKQQDTALNQSSNPSQTVTTIRKIDITLSTSQIRVTPVTLSSATGVIVQHKDALTLAHDVCYIQLEKKGKKKYRMMFMSVRSKAQNFLSLSLSLRLCLCLFLSRFTRTFVGFNKRLCIDDTSTD